MWFLQISEKYTYKDMAVKFGKIIKYITISLQPKIISQL